MRLIDADKLKVYRCDDSASRATFDYIYEDDVEDAPTIDIVRCGECEYADEYNHCKYSAWWNGNADFCSHGIRRKESR